MVHDLCRRDGHLRRGGRALHFLRTQWRRVRRGLVVGGLWPTVQLARRKRRQRCVPDRLEDAGRQRLERPGGRAWRPNRGRRSLEVYQRLGRRRQREQRHWLFSVARRLLERQQAFSLGGQLRLLVEHIRFRRHSVVPVHVQRRQSGPGKQQQPPKRVCGALRGDSIHRGCVRLHRRIGLQLQSGCVF